MLVRDDIGITAEVSCIIWELLVIIGRNSELNSGIKATWNCKGIGTIMYKPVRPGVLFL